jgi:hypothetical protein
MTCKRWGKLETYTFRSENLQRNRNLGNFAVEDGIT